MKTTRTLLTGLLTFACGFAAPFNRDHVASDSKWFAHIDVDGLRDSELGGLLLTLLRDKIDEAVRNEDLPVTLKSDAILAEIHSITAYGTSFDEDPQKSSVLIVRAGEKLHAVLDGALAGQEMSGEKSGPVRALTDKGFPAYLIGDEAYLAMPRKDLIMVSMNYAQIEKALAVMNGRSSGLAAGSALLPADAAGNYFLFASAEGFSESRTMPPQARILQKAKGARFALGEQNGELTTRLVLATTGAEVSNQLRRIIDGMIALLSFAEAQNPSIALLTRSFTVTEDSDAVGVSLRYPVAEIKPLADAVMSNGKPSPDGAASDPGDGVGGQALSVSYTDARTDNGNLGRNATDGNPDTHWGATGNNVWLRCELEETSLVREVRIAWHEGDKKKFRFVIQASMDGVEWKPVLNRQNSGATLDAESYDVTDTTARWIRILCPGRAPGILGISEITFFGEVGVAVAPAAAPQPAPVP